MNILIFHLKKNVSNKKPFFLNTTHNSPQAKGASMAEWLRCLALKLLSAGVQIPLEVVISY